LKDTILFYFKVTICSIIHLNILAENAKSRFSLLAGESAFRISIAGIINVESEAAANTSGKGDLEIRAFPPFSKLA